MEWTTSTNKGTALLKWVHQLEDDPLFRDEWVSIFFDESERAIATDLFNLLKSDLDTEETRFLRYVYDYVNLREKHGDEAIAQAIKTGCRQLVLLGSGYDTRFFRLPDIQHHSVKTFEVDLPQTIQSKADHLTRTLDQIPESLVFIDIDFNQQQLDRIFEFGFQSHQPAAYIWQGVSYYLPQENVSQVLDFIGSNMAEQSMLVFDCCTPLMTFKNDEIPGIAYNIDKLAEIGEPYRFGMYPDDMKSWLRNKGFQQIEILMIDELEQHSLHRKTLPNNGWYIVVAR